MARKSKLDKVKEQIASAKSMQDLLNVVRDLKQPERNKLSEVLRQATERIIAA